MRSDYITTFLVPQHLAASCSREAAIAVVAVRHRMVADFRYVRDLVPEFEGDEPGDGSWAEALEALKDDRCADALRVLREKGAVHAGMLTPHEFLHLKRLFDQAAEA